MTVDAAISPAAMAAARAARRGVVRASRPPAPASGDSKAELRISAAVRAFMQWFAEQRSAGEIAMPGERILDVQQALSNRFCIGLLDKRYYLGIPPECGDWFGSLPWMHVNVAQDGASLALVCDHWRRRPPALAAFAMTFDRAPAAVVQMLSNYHFLDVRVLHPIDSTEMSGSRPVRVGRSLVTTLEVRVSRGGRQFSDLLDGRVADGRFADHFAGSPGAVPR